MLSHILDINTKENPPVDQILQASSFVHFQQLPNIDEVSAAMNEFEFQKTKIIMSNDAGQHHEFCESLWNNDQPVQHCQWFSTVWWSCRIASSEYQFLKKTLNLLVLHKWTENEISKSSRRKGCERLHLSGNWCSKPS